MTYQAIGKLHDAIGNATIKHELAGKHKEGNGQEREDLHPTHHFLKDHSNG